MGNAGTTTRTNPPGEDWTPGYVVIFLIPAIFALVALVSVLLDRRERRRGAAADGDIEMARFNEWWFPWKDAIRASEPEAFEDGPATGAAAANPNPGSRYAPRHDGPRGGSIDRPCEAGPSRPR